MLLTKPLSTFLNANRSPQIHTLLLTTPTGKLLSSSSSLPASALRGYATVASQLWSMYKPLTEAGTLTAALSPRGSDDDDDDDDDEEAEDEPEGSDSDSHAHARPDPAVSSILIQLEAGTMVVRALRCALLFVVIGPSPPSPSSSLRSLTQGISYLSVASAAASSPASPHAQGANGEGPAAERRLLEGASANVNGLGGGGAAALAAVGLMGHTGGSVKVIRRQAEELAKWLDAELEGLSLSTGL